MHCYKDIKTKIQSDKALKIVAKYLSLLAKNDYTRRDTLTL